jgi:hypothetical protein
MVVSYADRNNFRPATLAARFFFYSIVDKILCSLRVIYSLNNERNVQTTFTC